MKKFHNPRPEQAAKGNPTSWEDGQQDAGGLVSVQFPSKWYLKRKKRNHVNGSD